MTIDENHIPTSILIDKERSVLKKNDVTKNVGRSLHPTAQTTVPETQVQSA